jgi:hypothetical protein
VRRTDLADGGGRGRRLPAYARRGIAAGASLLAVTAAIGALHTSWGRPLLARLGGCPAMRATAADVDALRLKGVGGIRGARPAPARPALGFALDRTTPGDVRAWAARAGVSCIEKKHGLLSLHCQNVPRTALPQAPADPAGGDKGRAGQAQVQVAIQGEVIEDLSLTFNPADHLVSVDAFTRRLPTAVATAAFSSSDARLGTLLGPPTDLAGGGNGNGAAPPPPALLGTARRRYRFNDYIAIVSLTNLSSGFAVREQYLSGS